MRKDMCQNNYPVFLWGYFEERQGEIFSVTARDLFQLNGTNLYTITFGDEYEISNMCDFGWYELCHYFDYSDVSMLLFQNL